MVNPASKSLNDKSGFVAGVVDSSSLYCNHSMGLWLTCNHHAVITCSHGIPATLNFAAHKTSMQLPMPPFLACSCCHAACLVSVAAWHL
jgi:hypothetical protein